MNSKRPKPKLKICLNCKKEFLVHNCRFKKAKYCTSKCMGEYFTKTKKFAGKNNASWKGGKGIWKGYTRISLGDGTRRLEHQYLMEKLIGRKLKKGEVVHHIDGDRSNNNIGNLALMTISEHMKLHNNYKKYE